MTEGEFTGKIGDYLFLQGFQQIFVKLGVIKTREEMSFSNFAGWAGPSTSLRAG